MAEASHQASITNALDMYNYCKDSLVRDPAEKNGKCCHFRRNVLFIPRESICHARNRVAKTLPGTRKIHSLKTVKPGIVAVRNVTCFCTACVSGFGKCEKLSIC